MRCKIGKFSGVFLPTIWAFVFCQTPAHAQAPELFKGKTITVYIATPAGGSFDLYGRLLARHIGRHLPGRPTVIAANMPGAGGITCTNFTYNVAPKDGTAIAIFHQTMGDEQALEAKGVHFDVAKFNWIGRVTSNVEMTYTSSVSATKTIEDAQNRVTILGAGGGPGTIIYPVLLNNLVGTRFKLIRGYGGTQNAHLAMERGEVEGATTSYNTVRTTTDWLATGKVNVLVQYAPARHSALPHVRTIEELAHNEEDKALFAFLTQASAIGRSFAAPPGVPQERLAILRAAFNATMRDSQFLVELAQAQAEYDPLPGEILQQVVSRRIELSPTNRQRVQTARREQ
jgi:tripartite-type tricarboxylate transporter receptor subunit TctC